jgi:hypothetical protein
MFSTGSGVWSCEMSGCSKRDVTVTVVAPTTFARAWVATYYGDRLFALWRAEDERIGEFTIVSPPLVRLREYDELEEIRTREKFLDDPEALARSLLENNRRRERVAKRIAAHNRPTSDREMADRLGLPRSPVAAVTGLGALELPRRSQTNRGGRAPKFDWEALWFELIKIAQIDGFNSRRELRERSLDWIATNWVDEPSDSVLREKLSRLGDILNLPTN